MKNEHQKPKLTIVENIPDIPPTNAVEPLENPLSDNSENIVPIDKNDPDPDPVRLLDGLKRAKEGHPSRYRPIQ